MLRCGYFIHACTSDTYFGLHDVRHMENWQLFSNRSHTYEYTLFVCAFPILTSLFQPNYKLLFPVITFPLLISMNNPSKCLSTPYNYVWFCISLPSTSLSVISATQSNGHIKPSHTNNDLDPSCCPLQISTLITDCWFIYSLVE
jgi:hypothetical protein